VGLTMITRARQVVSRAPWRVVYKFPSIKVRRTVYCESSIELDYAFLLDSDHGDVLYFQEQPGKITYHLHGKLHTYTPDFLVIRRSKKQIVEVKPESKVSSEENIIMFGVIEPICLEADHEFIVVTDMKIRVQPRLDNIKLLWKYGRTPIYPQHQIYCQEFFGSKRAPVLGELCEFFAYRKEGRAVVFSLLYWGVVGIDINVPINKDAPVYLVA
jgi:TnsA-like endonuclease N terminal